MGCVGSGIRSIYTKLSCNGHDHIRQQTDVGFDHLELKGSCLSGQANAVFQVPGRLSVLSACPHCLGNPPTDIFLTSGDRNKLLFAMTTACRNSLFGCDAGAVRILTCQQVLIFHRRKKETSPNFVFDVNVFKNKGGCRSNRIPQKRLTAKSFKQLIKNGTPVKAVT